MTIVIADDITGAAEMAGIACCHGQSTSLLTERAGGAPSCEVLVIATDTRSMTEAEAVVDDRHRRKRQRAAGKLGGAAVGALGAAADCAFEGAEIGVVEEMRHVGRPLKIRTTYWRSP